MPIHDIIKACGQFSKAQNIQMLRLLISMGVTVVENADGCRVNLDRLTPDQIILIGDEIKKVDSPVEAKYMID